MNIEQEKEIVASLSSLYPMQKFEEEAIDVVLDALSKRIPCSECERGVIVNGVEIPKNCAECPAGTYEYNENDERCFVCGFIKSQHQWECEHAEIDGIDTTKMRAHFCPIAEVATPHWIPVTKEEMFKAGHGKVLSIVNGICYIMWEDKTVSAYRIDGVRCVK